MTQRSMIDLKKQEKTKSKNIAYRGINDGKYALKKRYYTKRKLAGRHLRYMILSFMS